MPSDEELMDAYVAGDPRAFEGLFGRVRGPVLALMRRGYLDPATCEDLVQQVFLHLHRARFDYRSGRPLRPWLMTIARNVKRDFLRRARRRREAVPLLEGDTALDDPRPLGHDAREALDRALARLPSTLRRVVVGHYFEHRSMEEVARSLGISRSAAKVRAHRAYRALRELLSEGPGGGGEGCDRSGPSDVREGE